MVTTIAATLRSSSSWLLLLVLLLATFTAAATAASSSSSYSDLYQNNGGLVAAVAGRDWVVVCCDTRLTGSTGTDVAERRHTASRLCAVSPAASFAAPGGDGQFREDGSVAAAAPDGEGLAPSAAAADDGDEPRRRPVIRTLSTRTLPLHEPPPVLLASAGCSADCEFLKRCLRSELRRAASAAETTASSSSSSLPERSEPASVAAQLQHVLYRRRAFPYYAFCVLAGLSSSPRGGQAYVYDAIGSHEQVAVACSGTGRELLQPVLDRQFSTLAEEGGGDDDSEEETTTTTATTAVEDVATAGTAAAARRRGTSSALVSSPSRGKQQRQHRVQGTAGDAVNILWRAYRAVAERDVAVGDAVVFCVLQQTAAAAAAGTVAGGRSSTTTTTCSVLTAPLKKH
jgi:20S proteasome alpha/beta subunit